MSKVLGGFPLSEIGGPWLGFIFDPISTTNENLLCSGVLVTRNALITSRKCLSLFEDNLENVRVVFSCEGFVNNFESCNQYSLNLPNGVGLDPDFDPLSLNNDNVIFVLDTLEVIESSPLKILETDDINEFPSKTPLFIRGLGATKSANNAILQDYSNIVAENRENVGVLTGGMAGLLSTETCQSFLDAHANVMLQDNANVPEILNVSDGNSFCATPLQDNVSPCSVSGDIGAAAVFNCAESLIAPVFVGHLTWNVGCGIESNTLQGNLINREFVDDFLSGIGTGELPIFVSVDPASFCAGSISVPNGGTDNSPTSFPTLVSSDWICPNIQWGGANGCHCRCGSHDPDCDFQKSDFNVINCDGQVNVDADSETLQCIQGNCIALPRSWKCDDVKFGQGDGCDCDCGAVDPDCVELDEECGDENEEIKQDDESNLMLIVIVAVPATLFILCVLIVLIYARNRGFTNEVTRNSQKTNAFLLKMDEEYMDKVQSADDSFVATDPDDVDAKSKVRYQIEPAEQ